MNANLRNTNDKNCDIKHLHDIAYLLSLISNAYKSYCNLTMIPPKTIIK